MFETLPRLGYRFIGQLNETACNEVPATMPVLDVATNPHTSRWSAGRLRLIAALVAFLVGFSVFKWQGLWRGHATKPQIKSLAVLPLENLSGDAAQEYFADGMTDEVITRLAKNPAFE